MKCIEKFVSIYGREPEAVSFCPYRICPLGAHSDHQLGKITGFDIIAELCTAKVHAEVIFKNAVFRHVAFIHCAV